MRARVVAIVGSYRRGGAADSVVEAVLDGARVMGAQTQTFRLNEQHIEFCKNCRACTQLPGTERGRCVQEDDLGPILEEIEAASALVLASPVNFYNVTAIFRRFLERLLGFAYWPWGKAAPKVRKPKARKKAILVATSAAPGIFIPLATGAARALRLTAKVLGAKPVGSLWVGLLAGDASPRLSARKLERARRVGMKLA
jgi:multimeric flavodoxin WrbA